MNSTKFLIEKRRRLRKLRVPEFFIEFYFGLYFKYPICCILQFSIENTILPRFFNPRKCKNISHGYTHNKWFNKLDLKYVPCSFHSWIKMGDLL